MPIGTAAWRYGNKAYGAPGALGTRRPGDPTASGLAGGYGAGGGGGAGGYGAGGYGGASSPYPPGQTPGAAPGAAPRPAGAPGGGSPISPYRQRPSRVEPMLEQYGAGLLDPNSEYSRRLQEALTGRIGGETEAQKRLASFEAAQSGYGTGESAELMAALGDIGVGGEEALGGAMGDLMMAGPGMGLEFLQPAGTMEMGYEGQRLQEWRERNAMEQQARQAAMQSAYQGRGLDLESERLQNEAFFNQLAMMFS